MNEQNFIIYFEGAELNDEFLDASFEAGCDDAIFGSRSGRCFAEFDREAETLGAAVAAAIGDLTAVSAEVRIVGFDSASPVSQSTIAEHAGMSREGLRLIAAGDRGPGDFPAPLFFSKRSPFYSWGETHQWLAGHGYQCTEGADPDSEIALESIFELLRLSQLQQHWTTRTRTEIERVAEALPERKVLRTVLTAMQSGDPER